MPGAARDAIQLCVRAHFFAILHLDAPAEPSASAATIAPTEKEDFPAPSSSAMLDTLTLEEKVGQLFLVCCPQGDAAAIAAQYQFGSYILFGPDFKNRTRQQVVAIQSYQDVLNLPMLITVDE